MTLARWIRTLTMFLLTVLLIWGCGKTVSPIPKQALTDCQAIEHAAGTTQLCHQPRKIAVLSPYGLDLLLSLGEQPAAYAGVSASRQQFNHPVTQIPYLGNHITTQPINLGDRHQPSLEALVSLKPDLILGEVWQGSQGQYDRLAQIAPTILLDDQHGWQHNLQQVAQAVDRADAISQIMATRQQQIMLARQKLTSIIQAHPRVLLLSSGNFADGFYAFGQERSIYTDLLEALGFKLVHLDESLLGNANAPMSIEVLPQIKADILIVIGWDKTDTDNRPLDWQQLAQQWNQIPVLGVLPISQARQVYFMDAYLTMVRGPLAEVQILNDLLQQLASNQ